MKLKSLNGRITRIDWKKISEEDQDKYNSEDVDIDKNQQQTYNPKIQLKQVHCDDDKKITTVHPYEHYFYRNNELMHLDFYTYTGTILVRKLYKKKSKPSSTF